MYGPLNWTPLSAWHSPLLNVNPAGLPSLTLAVQMPLMQHSHRSISPLADFLIQYPSLGRKVFFQLCICILLGMFETPWWLLVRHPTRTGVPGLWRQEEPSNFQTTFLDCWMRLNRNVVAGARLELTLAFSTQTGLWGLRVASTLSRDEKDARRSLLSCSQIAIKLGLLYAPYWNQVSKTSDESWIFNDFK